MLTIAGSGISATFSGLTIHNCRVINQTNHRWVMNRCPTHFSQRWPTRDWTNQMTDFWQGWVSLLKDLMRRMDPMEALVKCSIFHIKVRTEKNSDVFDAHL
jgi:hypothetical protein